MEKLVLTEPIKLLCITAKSFPEGIKDAFDTLSNRITNSADRVFFGISYPSSASITYKAAVEQKDEQEAMSSELEKFTIPVGIYLTEKIEDFMQNIPLIGETFQKLLANPQLEQFPCIEWYQNAKDVMCMVKIRE